MQQATMAELKDIQFYSMTSINNVEIRTDYMGRYGAGPCVAFITDEPFMVISAMHNAQTLYRNEGRTEGFIQINLRNLVSMAKQDRMGKSGIIYFPGLQLKEEDDAGI